MAVRLRMKRLGRRHRPFFRICAMDSRAPRDGRVIEELGCYDPMVPETDARVTLKQERVDYWLSVGAQPTPKVAVLIRKYGSAGTHLDEQQQALERLAQQRQQRPEPIQRPAPKAEEPAAEAPADQAEASAEEAAPAEEAAAPSEESPAAEAEAKTE